MIRYLMLAACAALGINSSASAYEDKPQPPPGQISPSLPPTSWDGFAISRDGRRVFRQDSQSEELVARGQARRECEQATGTHCRAIADPDNWGVAGILCNDGNGKVEAYLGGSQYGLEQTVAEQHSSDDFWPPSDCRLVYRGP